MRFTADLIDEEVTLPELISKDEFERNCAAELRNFDSSNLSNVCTTVSQMRQQVQKMHEVTEQFKNLHLYDLSSSTFRRRNFQYHDASSGVPELASSSMQAASEKQTKKDGEINVSDIAGATAMNSSEMSPAWLQQYLLKMKQEIKKEILDETLHSPFSWSKNVVAAKLDENPIDFQGEIIHTGIFCDNCDQLIHGIRYKCGNCSDFDLCQECESLPNVHSKTHIFLKIRYPLALKLYQTQKFQELATSSGGKIYMRSGKSQSKKLYEAKFIRDETIPDSTVLPPSTKFVKSWRVMNSGTRVWNHATKLQLIQGSAELLPSNDQVDVPHLKPGEEGVVFVVFTTPTAPGVYRSHWNFRHKSRPFGDIVWCHITVLGENLQVDNLLVEKSNTNGNETKEKVEVKKETKASSIADVLTAVEKEQDIANVVPRKLVFISHTATPTNTPFDLTPPKSPDHHETSVKDVNTLAPNERPEAKDSDDEECSVLSLGSSDSDTEFVVIPMPKCFNLSESYIARNVPSWIDLAADSGNESTRHDSNPGRELEIPTITTGNVQPVTSVKKLSLGSETVSQETGVPEISENSYFVMEQNEKRSSINHMSVSTDGISSEILIVDSDGSMTTIENATQTIDTINITLPADNCGSDALETVEIHLANTAPNDSAQDETKTENETIENSSSATFPKFPVEGVTHSFDPAQIMSWIQPGPAASDEDSTVKVLPERLVTGALSAAATVYNTARAALTAIQQPRTERGVVLSGAPSSPTEHAPLNPIDQLVEMGFCNRQQNEELLKKHKGEVPLVVADLVSLNDNDWFASRHVPATTPTFD